MAGRALVAGAGFRRLEVRLKNKNKATPNVSSPREVYVGLFKEHQRYGWALANETGGQEAFFPIICICRLYA